MDRPIDLDLVDDLARLQLAARRLGCEVRLVDPQPELVELLALVGLRVEMCGKPEQGEDAGVEEGVHPDDPVA